MGEFFAKNKKTNKSIAIVLLLILLLQGIGLMQALGWDLSTLGVGWFNLETLLNLFGLPWTIYGLYKHHIGA